MTTSIEAINELVREKSAFLTKLTAEVGRVIVGQRHIIDRMLIGLLCRGHILVEGVPGLAKTLAVQTIAETIKAKFQRIQFTPDLLPADLVGTQIYNVKTGSFDIRKGPIFANIILADEINRAPAKVQSALLEAMQEKQVTIGETTFRLEEPFVVLATQNPIEQEGTYPLPEAQVDRFLMKLTITYPTKQEELEIVRLMSAGVRRSAEGVVTPEQVLEARSAVDAIYMDDKVMKYIVEIVHASRRPKEHKMGDLDGLVLYGASPRAAIALSVASKAVAFMAHRGYVTPDDVKSVAMDCLRHRIIPTYEAEAENVTSESIVRRILDTVEVP